MDVRQGKFDRKKWTKSIFDSTLHLLKRIKKVFKNLDSIFHGDTKWRGKLLELKCFLMLGVRTMYGVKYAKIGVFSCPKSKKTSILAYST